MKKILVISPPMTDISVISNVIFENRDKFIWASDKHALDQFIAEKPDMVIFVGLLHIYCMISLESELKLLDTIKDSLLPEQKLYLIAFAKDKEIYNYHDNFIPLPVNGEVIRKIVQG